MKSIQERFWNNVEKTKSCWLWTGGLISSGYGRVSFNRVGGYYLAHRFAYMICVGEIPKGLHICHRCDIKICVNPSHLFLGTPTDNMIDKISKGRQAKGEAVNTAKLTPDEVRKIRTLLKNTSRREIARQFNVSHPTINAIYEGRTWKSVN